MAITTKECNYDDMRPHLVRLIERHRIEDDPVLYCCDVSAAPNHWLGYLWGNPEPYDYAHAITLHKIISARRSKIYHSIGSVSSLDLVDVVAIEPAFDPRYGYMVAVHSEGMGVLECPISQAAQAKLIGELEAAVAAAKSAPAPEPSPDQPNEETAAGVADRLQRLDELLATGIITADEHQQRRQAILAEL
jgi:hypothetical protein